jgi:hypothetical protein
MKKRILYGVANYEEIVAQNGYFIDKTQYIERLEEIENPVFLRPRRFGKSLWCRILECYYSIRQKDRFEELFGNTWIGNNPTPLKNAFIVLHLDFSTIELGKNVNTIRTNFHQICNGKMDGVTRRYICFWNTIAEISRRVKISLTVSCRLHQVQAEPIQVLSHAVLPPTLAQHLAPAPSG